MPSDKDVLWMIYRDEGNVKKDLDRFVKFSQACLDAYQRKTGLKPGFLGVPSSFPGAVEETLVKSGIQVVHNLPAWATCEVWVGAEDHGHAV